MRMKSGESLRRAFLARAPMLTNMQERKPIGVPTLWPGRCGRLRRARRWARCGEGVEEREIAQRRWRCVRGKVHGVRTTTRDARQNVHREHAGEFLTETPIAIAGLSERTGRAGLVRLRPLRAGQASGSRIWGANTVYEHRAGLGAHRMRGYRPSRRSVFELNYRYLLKSCCKGRGQKSGRTAPVI